MGQKLRDALDRSRQGIDELEVQVLRVENAGCSNTQVGLGVAICITSFLTLIVIPHFCLIQAAKEVYYYMNFLLIGIIVGIILIS